MPAVMNSPIILAVDTKDVETAAAWIDCTREYVSTYKIGLEFFLKHGASGIAELRRGRQFDLFLDLKLHDIPNTVAGAVESVAQIAPKFLTVHAGGGSAMIRAAAGVDQNISITAVTILTSLSDEEVAEIGFAKSAHGSALELAVMAANNGARSIVSSPFEVSDIRSRVGSSITLITPGVRPVGSDKGDQSRVMSPAQAIAAGSDYLVIGRPISGEWKNGPEAMSKAAAAILDSLN